MKSISKSFLATLILLILFNACSDEAVEISPDAQNFQFIIQKGNLDNFTAYSDDLKTGVSPFAKSLKEKSNNSTSRDTYSEFYDFYLDTTNVQLIDNGYLKSYAMPIVRENLNFEFLENYIITFYQDGSHTQWIAKYVYDDSHPNGFDMQNTEINVIEDPNLLLLSTSRSDCPPHLVQYGWDSNAGDCIDLNCTAGGDHAYGEACDALGTPKAARRICSGGWVVEGCAVSGGGSSGSGNGGNDPSGGGQGGIGPGTPSNPDEICLQDCPPLNPVPLFTPCTTPFGSGYVNESGECIIPFNADAIINSLEQDYKARMSAAEIEIYDSLSRGKKAHYLDSAWTAEQFVLNMFNTPCDLLNGKGDALRHAIWNALSVQHLGLTLTNNLTTAHEERPFSYPFQGKEKTMDLINNSIGATTGGDFLNILASKTTIANALVEKMNNGELFYLSNTNPTNCTPTGSSVLIPTNQ